MLYPRVICQDPGDLVAELPLNSSHADRRDRPTTDFAALAKRERFYKLSALDGVRFRQPYWCSVKYGPWLAVVVERESCITGEPNSWELVVVEVPEVSLRWYGRWEDIPPFPSLTVIMGDLAPAGHTTQCCPGYKWCQTTESCIPFAVDCQDQVPA